MPKRIADQLTLNGSVLEQISQIQKYFARQFEFENLDVLLGNEEPITRQYLLDKIIDQGRGGLCYELNGLLYIVLQDLGIPVHLAAATVWAPPPKNCYVLDRTHVVNMLRHEDTWYIIDSGFGSNLVMQPVALDGDPAVSPAGTFRLRSETTEKGTMVFERLTDGGWERCYGLYPDTISWEHLDQVKQQIHHSPESSFNKALLIAKATSDGTYSINEKRFNRKRNGHEETIPFKDHEELLEQVRLHAAPAVYEAAKRYSKQRKPFYE
ncbi:MULTISPECIES: arylamine N-acetyltransferase [unclassified Sporosarcina]|uniref:arylamine N-acetyltransferase family protein n=1 Tax=unclassified Sporosarcina TaxID=2647733 RepID=UPI00203D7CC9|nr:MULTISPECIES: arylamine N-acetyltransferase [unclassified Sporosarcina]GKV65555.1 putative acetyltransferase YvcN [Sporosarcina sp. NCCP-2331]GLB55680.1 putative acetyltransferase YvcN [Sporosarcina sp. NCCP-2378]